MGPFSRASQAFNCVEDAPPEAAVLDVALRDGLSFGPAQELLRRNSQLLFYTSWGDMDLIPDQLRGMPLLAKPAHVVLVAKLLLKLVKDRQSSRTPLGR